mgnify:CR=1 FL=1
MSSGDLWVFIMSKKAATSSTSADKPILVTGSSGHLGANLVRTLLSQGKKVRVLLRRGSNNSALEGLEVDRVFGDLRQTETLVPALEGCDYVYHCAAVVSTLYGTPALKREIFESNVVGTRNLLQVAKKQGVKRVVVSGSLSATGYDLDDPAKATDESWPFYPFQRPMPYEVSKSLVELECLKACAEGLDVVIATSCAILGPNDYKPSRMGKTLCDFAQGKLRAYIPGGFEFVAAKDIVQGHILAMEKGRSGQKYTISTRFVTVDELMEIFERVTGHPKPKLRMPPQLMAAVAEVTAFAQTYLLPKSSPRLTPGAIRILRKQRHTSTQKAQSELGYKPSSIEDAVREAYEDFIRRGLIPGKSASSRSAQASVQPAPSAPQPNGAAKPANKGQNAALRS